MQEIRHILEKDSNLKGAHSSKTLCGLYVYGRKIAIFTFINLDNEWNLFEPNCESCILMHFSNPENTDNEFRG